MSMASPELVREGRPELQHPPPDCLVGDLDAALGQQVFNVPEAQGEAEV
jgi:hypothetical protein